MIEKLKEKVLLNIKKALIEEIKNMDIENENKDVLDEIRNEFYEKFSKEFTNVFSEFINNSLEDIAESLSNAIISVILKTPDEQSQEDEAEKTVRKGYLLALLSIVEDELNKIRGWKKFFRTR